MFELQCAPQLVPQYWPTWVERSQVHRPLASTSAQFATALVAWFKRLS